MNNCKVVIGVLVVSMIAVSNVFAQSYRDDVVRIGEVEFEQMKGVRMGPAFLKGGLSTAGHYDSNIFLSPNNKKRDYINVTTTQFLVDLPMGMESRHLAQLMYVADAGAFSDFKSQNYVNQTAAGNLFLRTPFGYFNLQNDYKNTEDRAGTEFTDQIRRHENTAKASVGVEINKLTYEIGFSDYMKRYYETQYQGLDYNEDIMSTTVFYQLFSKTKALLEYDHAIINYTKDETRDGDYDQVMTGLRGEITGKTVGLLKVGYQKRIYDFDGTTGFEGFVSESGIVTRFSERTELKLKYISRAMESIYLTNNYYDTNTFTINLNQGLFGHFKLLALSSYSFNRYPEIDATLEKRRKDSIITEGLTLRYTPREWANVNLGYQYKESMSNFDTLDYNDHLVSLGLDILF